MPTGDVGAGGDVDGGVVGGGVTAGGVVAGGVVAGVEDGVEPGVEDGVEPGVEDGVELGVVEVGVELGGVVPPTCPKAVDIATPPEAARSAAVNDESRRILIGSPDGSRRAKRPAWVPERR